MTVLNLGKVIQDWVEDYLMRSERRDMARAYIRYRYKKEMLRQSNTTDQSIKELLEGNNDYWNNENSNKNAKRTTVQRDYMAGIVSTDITRRFLLDQDIVVSASPGRKAVVKTDNPRLCITFCVIVLVVTS